jgi:hypothetical protein
MNRANEFFENMMKLKYFGMTPTELNCRQEEIKSKLNLGSACYHSLDKL